jgi:predicted secreted protein
MTLDHNDRDCCGLWKQQLISGRLYWRCQDCQAIAYHCDAVAEAAIRENQFGVTLRQLSNAGDYWNLPTNEESGHW